VEDIVVVVDIEAVEGHRAWPFILIFSFNVDFLDCEMCVLVVPVDDANLSSFHNGRDIVALFNCEVLLVVVS
jgi:hypothetical protein